MEGICPVLQQQPKALRVAQTGGDQERCIPVLVHQVDISGCVAVIGLVQAVGQGLAIILSHVHEYICSRLAFGVNNNYGPDIYSPLTSHSRRETDTWYTRIFSLEWDLNGNIYLWFTLPSCPIGTSLIRDERVCLNIIENPQVKGWGIQIEAKTIIEPLMHKSKAN